MLFFISCQAFEVTQATKTKVNGGRPNSPSFYEYEVFVTVKKGDVLFSKIIVNNTIEQKEFSVKNNESKKIFMNTQTVQSGTYILSYKLKERQIKDDKNDAIEIVMKQNGKEQRLKTTATFKGVKNKR